MIEPTGAPELPQSQRNDAATPTKTSGIERRTLVKGAAWSLPVIALAVGAPAASASTPWNIGLSAGCLVGVVGVNVIPGYTIHETTGTKPTKDPLTFTETFTTVVPITWTGGTIGHGLIKGTADAFALALGLVFLTASSIGGKSSALTISGWSAFTGVESPAYVNQGIGGSGRSVVTYTATRTVSAVGMVGGGTFGYGYVAGLSIPSLGTGLTTATTQSVLTATGGSGGATR